MNDENLKKGKKTQFNSDTAARAGRKGGKVTAKKRKDERLFYERARDVLFKEYTNKDGTKTTGLEAMLLKLLEASLDVKNRNFISAQRLFYQIARIEETEDDKKMIELSLLMKSKEIELLQKKIDKEEDWS